MKGKYNRVEGDRYFIKREMNEIRRRREEIYMRVIFFNTHGCASHTSQSIPHICTHIFLTLTPPTHLTISCLSLPEAFNKIYHFIYIFSLPLSHPPNHIILYTFFKKPWDKQLEYIDYFKPIIRFYSILKPLMGAIGSI